MSARKKKRHPFLLFGLISVGILLGLFIQTCILYPAVPTRIGGAIVGEPTVIFSYDSSRNTFAAVGIPSDVYVDVTRGYGTYPISSVWKLDRMDNRRGAVFIETMEEMVGIPIRFFIEPKPPKEGLMSLEEEVHHALSFSSYVQTLFQKERTNIPPGLLFKLIQAFQGMSPTEMTFFDLRNQAVFTEGVLADGTKVRKIDPGKLSLLLGTLAEDAGIRKENYRISVLNTTSSPGLAQKAARVMEGTGFHVVSIDNSEVSGAARCSVQGRHEAEDSRTVKTLLYLYGCTFEDATHESQSDITLVLGVDFEKRFFPF